MDLMPFMTQHQMLPPAGGRILCAVSGGRDSMCLLHYLWQLGQQENFTVAAVHMDHGQRDTAQRDVFFVQNFCRERRIPCVTERVSVPRKAEEWGVSIEEAGRTLRYETFARAAKLTGSDRIATAHHAADQAETVLLNLVRGAGTRGLRGMLPVNGYLARPFLGITRRDRAVVIGDSLASDIQGGINAGMDTVWFNPGHRPSDPAISPTWEVDGFGPLEALLFSPAPVESSQV